MTIETVTGETREAYMNDRLRVSPEPEAKPEPKAKAEPEVKGEVVAEAKEVADDAPVKEDDKPEETPHPKKAKLSERFSELTEKAKTAIARAEAAEARAAAAEAKLNPPEVKPVQEAANDGKPKPSDFTDAFEYAEKLAEWTTNQVLVKRDQEAAAKTQEAKRDTVVSAWKERAAAVESEFPDYRDVLASTNVAVSNPVRDAIMESDLGPRILYEIASDDALAESLEAKPGLTRDEDAALARKQLKIIGRLEAKFEKSPEAKEVKKPAIERPRAPAPITPVKGGRAADNALERDDLTFSEYRAARQAQLAKQHH